MLESNWKNKSKSKWQCSGDRNRSYKMIIIQNFYNIPLLVISWLLQLQLRQIWFQLQTDKTLYGTLIAALLCFDSNCPGHSIFPRIGAGYDAKWPFGSLDHVLLHQDHVPYMNGHGSLLVDYQTREVGQV